MKKQNPILVMVFAGVFLVAGVIILLWGITSSRSAFTSQKWPAETGTITASSIETSRSNKGNTMYSADIRYTYQVNGQGYTGSKVSFGDVSTSDSADARKIVSRYQSGQAVTVYYNPQDPQQAVLETGFSPGLFLPLGIGTVFSLVGGLLLIAVVSAYLRGDEASLS